MNNQTEINWNPKAFSAFVKDVVSEMCQQYGTWNTETATELYVSVIQYWVENDPEKDAENLRGFFKVFCNLNAVWNRLKEAGKITPKEKGRKSLSSDFI